MTPLSFRGGTMNELAIRKIIECLEENLFEPKYSWPEKAFEDRSYARWAAYEIWERLMDRPNESPDLIISEFMLQMILYENITEDPKKARIFSVAKETAEDILTLF